MCEFCKLRTYDPRIGLRISEASGIIPTYFKSLFCYQLERVTR